MKLNIIVIGILIFLASCVNGQGNSYTSASDTLPALCEEALPVISEDSIDNVHTSIYVRANFDPSIKVSDKIRNTTLEKLIYDYCASHEIGVNELSEYLQLSSSQFKEECKPIPDNSNLAKVYFIEDFRDFIKYNIDYFLSVRRKYEQDKKDAAQEHWQDYM